MRFARTRWIIRHAIFGSFMGAYRARRGLGNSRTREDWDADYLKGSWDYLGSIAERSHHMVVLGYVTSWQDSVRVLDAGCGDGGLLALAWNYPLAAYHGIDTSAVAIERARQRFTGRIPNFELKLEVGDFESFNSEIRYDVIVFNETLAYARDPVQLLQRFQRLLTPRGVFVISLCYNWWQEPVMNRILAAFETLNSTDVINEEGLMWRIRVLREAERIRVLPAGRAKSKSRRPVVPSRFAETGTIVAENLAAIAGAVPKLFRSRISRGKVSDDYFDSAKTPAAGCGVSEKSPVLEAAGEHAPSALRNQPHDDSNGARWFSRNG